MKSIPERRTNVFFPMITGIHITGGRRIYRKWLWLKGLLFGLLEPLNLVGSEECFFAKREAIC